ncbi:MAG: peptidase [Firmicutes bacterium]|nr:peptidase [Bacillota bacterium]
MIFTALQDNTDRQFDLQLFADGEPAPDTGFAAGDTGDAGAQSDTSAAEGDLLTGNSGEGEQKSEDGEQKGDKPTAPEKYEDFTMPEGMTWDAEKSAEFLDVAKELGLSQEQAQKLVNVGAKLIGGSQESIQQQAAEQSKAWREESLAKYQKADIELANKTLGQFATPEFKELLEATGLANSPAMIGIFKEIGEAISEGKFIEGNQATQKELSLAERLFGK